MEHKMATVQNDGTSSVTSSSTVNSGGVITANGTVLSNIVRSQSTAAAQAGVYSNVVVDNNTASKALSGGTFAYDNQRPTAVKTSTTLSGVTQTFLRSGANDTDNARSIHKVEKIRTRRTTTAIRNNKWDEYAGVWESGYPVNAVDNFWSISAGSGVSSSSDDAAAPTRSSPGELTYMIGNPNPKTDDYKAKTN